MKLADVVGTRIVKVNVVSDEGEGPWWVKSIELDSGVVMEFNDHSPTASLSMGTHFTTSWHTENPPYTGMFVGKWPDGKVRCHSTWMGDYWAATGEIADAGEVKWQYWAGQRQGAK